MGISPSEKQKLFKDIKTMQVEIAEMKEKFETLASRVQGKSYKPTTAVETKKDDPKTKNPDPPKSKPKSKKD